MPDEGKNKQAQQTKPEPGSPEARRQAVMWWVWLGIGFLAALGTKWVFGLLRR